jgi:ABC-type nitrate/sulfonate/bicarbonate transport system ATPase subunit
MIDRVILLRPPISVALAAAVERMLPDEGRTVEQKVRLAAPKASEAALAALFAALGLAEHRRHYPGELSLGLARRVALASHSIDEAIGLADRVILLSQLPSRVIAQIPVEHPRTTVSPAELAAARDRLKSAAAQGC